MKLSMVQHWALRTFSFASIMLLAGTSALAAMQVVKFGGSAGFKYVPASFTAAVGDTVAWEGDFSVHPLSSTTIPAGSTTWHVATGTRFTYVIMEQGTFNYKCDVHSGMTGSFQSGISGIGAMMPHRVGTEEAIGPIMLSSSSGRSSIRFTAPVAGVISVRIIDLNGREIASAESPLVQRGTQVLPLTGMNTNGIFHINIIFNGKETSRLLTNVH